MSKWFKIVFFGILLIVFPIIVTLLSTFLSNSICWQILTEANPPKCFLPLLWDMLYAGWMMFWFEIYTLPIGILFIIVWIITWIRSQRKNINDKKYENIEYNPWKIIKKTLIFSWIISLLCLVLVIIVVLYLKN